jgi:ribonuclease Z
LDIIFFIYLDVMKFSVTILGSSAAVPTRRRNPTAQLLNIRGRLVLIDCAEGTQLQLTRFNVPIQKISQVFISHMHGDHYYGLIGLISKFHLLGREKRLELYGPPGLINIIELNLGESKTKLNYPLEFHPLSFGTSEVIYSDKLFETTTVPLQHSVPTNGFVFREQPRLRNIKKEFAGREGLTYADIRSIKRGRDYTDPSGKHFRNEEITHDPSRSRSYAYLTDTVFDPSVVPYIKDVDLLYHEATFADDHLEAAAAKLHSTARQAAIIAREARVKKLILGHFSARYGDASLLVDQARQEFSESYAIEDGDEFKVLH